MTLTSLNQYGHDFQIKVISSLLTHKGFLTNIHDIISEEYFENQAHRWTIKEILSYYDKYHSTPNLEVLKVELQKVENEVLQIAIKEQLKDAYVAGDFGLIFGNPGGGKSWSLVALGGFAVKLGYNVLHYTLELGEDYVARRYDAFFTKIDVSKILNHKDAVEKVVPELAGKLIVKEFPTGKATISTVESHIAKCTDLGTKPDLVIIDYVDLLSSRRKNRERKDEIDDIYQSTKGLARELNIPIWSVSQVNRAGARDEIIEGDKAAGSYDKMMIADFAASLSRRKEDKERNTGRFHIMKNRYGRDGHTYSVLADTSTGHFSVKPYQSEENSLETTMVSNNRSNEFDVDTDKQAKGKLLEKFQSLDI